MAGETHAVFVLRWHGEGGEETRPIPIGEYTIGRDPRCDVHIDDPQVSREHARLTVSATSIVLRDQDSRNGSYVHEERVASADLRGGDRFRLGPISFEIVDPGASDQSVAVSAEGTIVSEPRSGVGATRILPAEPPERDEPGVLPARLLATEFISERDVEAAGVPVTSSACLALGGGLGSFVWVDYLRNSGVSRRDIVVVGAEALPHARYARLCANSQIPLYERLRSNSESCPDNVWGFPGYAPREIVRNAARGHLGKAAALLWAITGEPAVTQTYTPRSGDVFRSVEREAERIGWSAMLRIGRVRAIRKTVEGRLLALVSVSDGNRRQHVAFAADTVHLGLGYPAIQLLPELAAYRETYNDEKRIVNAYEPHDHIYEDLAKRGGTILLRGRGIVASRIIQRLWEERKRQPKIEVIHLHRSRLTEGHRDGLARRGVEIEFEFQPFNWPKSAWTGEQRERMERAPPEERKELLGIWGGTTTADRRDWKRIVREGLKGGWYRPEYGVVRSIKPTDDGRLALEVTNSLAGGGTLQLNTNYVVDCTGLIASPERSPLLSDMLSTYRLPMNPLGRLDVSDEFEVVGMRHKGARMFACGATTLGGPLPSVDSFLGLQYASFRAAHAMLDTPPRGLRSLNGLYSFRQWLKWARGVAP
ncbi:MAG: FHA domain-containing protein [Actinobacteria bacterium]|nr:FHA domain-containing protein [Actinomycetota bacterium]